MLLFSVLFFLHIFGHMLRTQSIPFWKLLDVIFYYVSICYLARFVLVAIALGLDLEN